MREFTKKIVQREMLIEYITMKASTMFETLPNRTNVDKKSYSSDLFIFFFEKPPGRLNSYEPRDSLI